MGGDAVSSGGESSLEPLLLQSSSFDIRHPRDDLSIVGSKNRGDDSTRDGFDRQFLTKSAASLLIVAEERMREKVYREVLQTYDQSQVRLRVLEEAKSKLLSYRPGAWTEKVGGISQSDYDIPETTSIVLIGPKGSGKSSLINRISNVLGDNKFASQRAQVSYNSTSPGDGTAFLQEYMMPKGSSAFCLYDTRGLSNNPSDNHYMIRKWITRGVRHGELVLWESDSLNLKNTLKQKAQRYSADLSTVRMVNYVIYVVNGVDVLKSLEKSDPDSTTGYNHLIASAFSCPYLSFKDDKPVVVVTHGDLLSLSARARIRVHLGELLRISPANQIFDIPESYDSVTKLALVDMLCYCLEHADKNLKIQPRKNWITGKVRRVLASICVHFLIIVVLSATIGCMLCIYKRSGRKSEARMDWNAIRYMWFDSD